MKICHVISSIDRGSGGTTEYLRLLTNKLSFKTKISIITIDSKQPIKFDRRVELKLCESLFNRYNYSTKLNSNLLHENCQLFHGNGLWEFPIYQMAIVAIKLQLPYVISTHGMLEPWSLNQGRFKKKIALKLFQYKNIAKAACIHATAPMEVENIRSLGFKNPIAMIPNGINLSEFSAQIPKKTTNPKKILFLSRIHEKKGIENLIEAWELVDKEQKKDWKIEIVGNGEEKYIQLLKDSIILKNLTQQIEIKAPVFGKDKIELFREASLFILPTFSENFGIVIAEALASHTPVITTKGTPWEDLNKFNCGWWIDIGVKPLKEALEEALLQSTEQLITKGNNGRKLIEKKYNMESIAKQMLQLYQWILTKEDKPNFVNVYE